MFRMLRYGVSPLVIVLTLAMTALLCAVIGIAMAAAPPTQAFTFEMDEQLYVVDVKRGTMRSEGTQHPFVVPLNLPLYRAGGPDWSPDGTRLALHGRTQHDNLNIYVVKTSAGAAVESMQQITRFQQGLNPRLVAAPRWSPDGTRIAFNYADSADSGVFVMDADGANVRRVTPPGSDARFGAWSPDSTQIAYLLDASISPLGTALYIMDVETEERTRLIDGLTRSAIPRWSPDGTRLLFASAHGDNGRGELYTLEIATGTLTNLTDNLTSLEQGPVWSPDGTQIAYASSLGNDRTLLYIMAADGGNPRRLETPRGCFSLDWSPDGQYLAFQCGEPGRWSVYVYTVASGDLREVLQGRVPYMGFRAAWMR